jgi:hypothetical protein
LLEAYKDLPENALADKFETVTPEGPETDSEPAAATEEISQTTTEEAESVAAPEEISQTTPAESETESPEKKSTS